MLAKEVRLHMSNIGDFANERRLAIEWSIREDDCAAHRRADCDLILTGWGAVI